MCRRDGRQWCGGGDGGGEGEAVCCEVHRSEEYLCMVRKGCWSERRKANTERLANRNRGVEEEKEGEIERLCVATCIGVKSRYVWGKEDAGEGGGIVQIVR